MANEKEIVKKDSSLGAIRIADEVVSIIAGLAATEVDGIAGMSGGIAGGIAEMLGRKNFAKGVKVEVGEKEAAVDLYIIVKYGVRIPDIALAVQENVKQAIETNTVRERRTSLAERLAMECTTFSPPQTTPAGRTRIPSIL